jgi:prepilin-type N-terminal cleavage/methylation domain-containing protein
MRYFTPWKKPRQQWYAGEHLAATSSAFTLIEILVVISIIAILASLGFPAMRGALESGRKAQARNDVQQIAAAIRAFQLEYGRLPSSDTGSDVFSDDNSGIMKALLGKDADLNPRNIAFLSPKATTTGKGGLDTASSMFYDPWGKPYFIKLNTDYDNVVEYYGDNYVAVVVGSMGPNKDRDDLKEKGADDILNFK